MFEAFTVAARKAVIAPQDHARSLGHGTVRPEHLVLALAAEKGPTSAGLRGLGVTVDGLRSELRDARPGPPPRQVALSDATEAVLIRARVEATIRRHRQITPGHVALALARNEQAKVLMGRIGISSDQVRFTLAPRLRCET